MCGLSGLIHSNVGVSARVMERMHSRLAHRGPDDAGFLGWRPGKPAVVKRNIEITEGAMVALAHHRLAIIDLDHRSAQPMTWNDGRYWLVYNGEIYNYLELRARLEARGHRFATHSDSEVLLAAYAEWGPEALRRFTGMFAFAILDTQEHTVFLARDPFGIKPLYYAITSCGLAFASEIPALVEACNLPHRIDPQAAFAYLRYGYTDRSDGHTLFDAVKRFPAGHHALISLENPQNVCPKCYWSTGRKEQCDIGFDEASSKLRTLMSDSIQLHLRSDTTVAATLSGGIDSSAIIALIRSVAGQDLDIHSFSFVSTDFRQNEERWAKIAGRSVGAHMHWVHLSGQDLPDHIDALIYTQGEPFGSASIYAQYRVYELIGRKGIKVALDGQGADELMGGYASYFSARLASLIQKGRPGATLRFARNAVATGNISTRAIWLHALRHLMPTKFPDFSKRLGRQLLGRPLVPHWLRQEWIESRGGLADQTDVPAVPDPLKAELAASIADVTLPALLRYQDRNAMAHAVESRVPFLTVEIAEFVQSLPEHYLIDSGARTKSVLRHAMRGLVPDKILDRRDKIGFATPQQDWLETNRTWMDNIMRDEMLDRAAPMINGIAIRQMFNEKRLENARDQQTIWRCMNFLRWMELFEMEFE